MSPGGNPVCSARSGPADWHIADPSRPGSARGSAAGPREAARILEPPAGTTDQGRTLTFARPSPRKPDSWRRRRRSGSLRRGVDVSQRAFRIVDEIVHQDPNDANSRGDSTAGTHLRISCVTRTPGRLWRSTTMCFAIWPRSEQPRFRRDEVRALAGSTYPLRRLGRAVDARQRLDAAFERLRQLKLYPAEQVDLGRKPTTRCVRSPTTRPARATSRARSRPTRNYSTDCWRQAEPGEQPGRRRRSVAPVRLAGALERRAGRADLAAALDTRRLNCGNTGNARFPTTPSCSASLPRREQMNRWRGPNIQTTLQDRQCKSPAKETAHADALRGEVGLRYQRACYSRADRLSGHGSCGRAGDRKHHHRYKSNRFHCHLLKCGGIHDERL